MNRCYDMPQKINADSSIHRVRQRTVTVYDTLLFVSSGTGYHIFDSFYNQWYSVENQLLPGPVMFDGRDNYLYCMGCNQNGQFHLQLDLMHLIPLQLIQKYKNRDAMYNKLVYGYMNENIRLFNIAHKYLDNLTLIILSYFPVFLYL